MCETVAVLPLAPRLRTQCQFLCVLVEIMEIGFGGGNGTFDGDLDHALPALEGPNELTDITVFVSVLAIWGVLIQ